jgi:hypothetical protein
MFYRVSTVEDRSGHVRSSKDKLGQVRPGEVFYYRLDQVTRDQTGYIRFLRLCQVVRLG